MPKKFWQFRNQAEDSAELLLYGDISDSSWWGDEVTPKTFADELNALGPLTSLTVRINSGGGDVFAAQTIGNLLEQHTAQVTARIDGLCASAATIIACHCDKVVAANDSTYMIHPVRMGIFDFADAVTLQQYIGALNTIRENILNLYTKKTGREKDEVAAWMDATSWWTGEEAKTNGFVDELVDDGEKTVVENRGGLLFVNSVNMNLPFDKAPKFVQNSVAAAPAASGFVNTQTPAEQPGNKSHKEDTNMANEIKTVDELRGAYPALVDQIEQAAALRATNAERQRIRDIEEMALPGSEQITNEAKYDKPMSASDYAKAGELQYGKLPTLQKQLEEEEKLAEAKKESSLLRDRVTEEEIANIVARWTGIPVSKLVEGEREKLLRLPDTLHQRVIGQDEAVQKVSDAILRSRAGIANPNRPIGSFLFLGPTGVGKTELAKALAQALFDDEKNMVRIDMTEYMEKFSVSRLIGAPPGYVGYEEGGQLTEAVRRHPYSVVLFDEVEKAHPDVFNILLQVLDDGRITDSQGRTVDFKNTVIILTSNLGSDLILEDLEKSRANGSNELSDEARNAIDQLLKRQFRPEFLNRLDDIVYYKSLTKTEIGSIVDLMLADLRKRLEDKQLKLVVTDAAKNAIIDGGYDPIYGARPLKRYIQSHVETMIAKEIIGGAHTAGDTLTVDADGNGQLVLR